MNCKKNQDSLLNETVADPGFPGHERGGANADVRSYIEVRNDSKLFAKFNVWPPDLVVVIYDWTSHKHPLFIYVYVCVHVCKHYPCYVFVFLFV